jgi:hypothetical protein
MSSSLPPQWNETEEQQIQQELIWLLNSIVPSLFADVAVLLQVNLNPLP